jgi:hypothetical protein
MINRGELLMLGISAGVSGSLIGGLLLFAGLALITSGANIGWLLLLPAGPAGALVGWILARRLARQLPPAS